MGFHRVMGATDTPILIVGNKRDLQRGRVIPRHNVSDLVRKSWKCGYVECSAKFNWHILLLFGEALRSVGCARCKHVHTTVRFQRALRRERCTLMWAAILSRCFTWFEKKASYSCDNELRLPSSQGILSWMFHWGETCPLITQTAFWRQGESSDAACPGNGPNETSQIWLKPQKSALISSCWNANNAIMLGLLLTAHFCFLSRAHTDGSSSSTEQKCVSLITAHCAAVPHTGE